MSAEPERIFSGPHHTISWTRCSLGGDTIEMLECLKSWIRQNIASGVGFSGVLRDIEKVMTSRGDSESNM
jgi:hypothetical protein